jgi:hypothetical protein
VPGTSGNEVRQRVYPGGVGHGVPRENGGGIGGGDVRVDDRAPRRIRNNPCNSAIDRLSAGAPGEGSTGENYADPADVPVARRTSGKLRVNAKPPMWSCILRVDFAAGYNVRVKEIITAQ